MHKRKNNLKKKMVFSSIKKYFKKYKERRSTKKAIPFKENKINFSRQFLRKEKKQMEKFPRYIQKNAHIAQYFIQISL